MKSCLSSFLGCYLEVKLIGFDAFASGCVIML